MLIRCHVFRYLLLPGSDDHQAQTSVVRLSFTTHVRSTTNLLHTIAHISTVQDSVEQLCPYHFILAGSKAAHYIRCHLAFFYLA